MRRAQRVDAPRRSSPPSPRPTAPSGTPRAAARQSRACSTAISLAPAIASQARRSTSPKPTAPSTTSTHQVGPRRARRARAPARAARAAPAPRARPAVSTSVTATPSSATSAATASRVVPGASSTSARSSPDQRVEQARLAGVDAPDERHLRRRGTAPADSSPPAPRISREISPSARALAASGAASPASSGKSIAPSSSASTAISRCRRRTMRSASAPAFIACAARSARSPRAPISAATDSARVRSIRPASNARRVNSPGSAMRAPAASTASSSRCITSGPPCPCSSATSSPVYDLRRAHHHREHLVDPLARRADRTRPRAAACATARLAGHGRTSLPRISRRARPREPHDADAAAYRRRNRRDRVARTGCYSAPPPSPSRVGITIRCR